MIADVDAVPGDGRDETESERNDRNWTEILQELRVIQTGTQILTAFLLRLPFQARFPELSPRELGIYLCLVGTSTLIFDVVVSPVAGIIAGGASLALAVGAWILVPFGVHRVSA